MRVSGSRSVATIATLALILIPTLATHGPRAAAPPGPYVVTDLGTLGGSSAQAYGVNEAGQVVGYATTAASQGHAFVWQSGVMSDLSTLGGPQSDSKAINVFGQMVGAASVTASSGSRAVLWDNGAMTDLTPGVPGSTAEAINDSGQIVGTTNHGIAFLWQNGVTTNLGHLGGGGSVGVDINNAGQAVGSSYTTHVTELGPMPHAFLWQNGVMIDLGVLPGEEDSGAGAINNLGQIVGSSGRTDPVSYEVTSRSFLYDGGVMTAVPVPSWESYAGDINDSGVIVGTMRAAGGLSSFHAYIYADGVVRNLNSLIPAGSGLHLAYATGINNAGQIVGVAYDSRANYHGFLLTPVASGTPVVNIGDASVTEGHAGTASASLTVTLSAASSQPVSVSYASANGTAVAGSDYQAASGTVTFAAGQTSRTIVIPVNGDRAGESNETFLVNLASATGGAAIADGQGLVTIVDDEPRISIDDVSKNEGDSGATQYTFTVSLSPASDRAVTVNFATANGSAKAGEDYDAKSGVVTFNAGETSRTLAVTVRGDRKKEPQELFYVNLSGASGVVVTAGQGTGIVRNDDR